MRSWSVLASKLIQQHFVYVFVDAGRSLGVAVEPQPGSASNEDGDVYGRFK